MITRKHKINSSTGQLEEVDDLMKEVDTGASFYWYMTYPSRVSISDTPTGDTTGTETMNNIAQNLKNAGGYGPAPKLEPINRRTSTDGGDKISTNTQTPSVHINVRDNHHWTESPISARREVPLLNLKEQRIMTNVALNQMLNMGFAAAEATGSAIESAAKVMDVISKKNLDYDSLSEQLKNITSGDASKNPLMGTSTMYSDPMNPYGLLYTTVATGFKYILPYMQNKFVSNQGSFGETATAGALLDSVGKLAEVGKELMQTANMNRITAPGRMVEQPKSFTFTGREKSYTVSFPLFNTRTYGEIVKNWQFIYLLSYQNTPNRVSRDLIDPPCIYEGYIPGIWYSKYAALTDMTVDFIGARREMYVPVHTIDHAENGNRQTATGNWRPYNKKMLAVIPDAYQVTLTFTELFSETQNFKYQMLRESMNDIITTGEISQ